jgi:hypothetical protein
MRALTLSIAFVLQITLRISTSKARKGTNSAQESDSQLHDRRILLAPGLLELQEPFLAASSLGAV